MAKQRPSKFDDLRDKAWRAVDDLSRSLAGKPLPVQLDQLASSYGIQYIQFEPLLSTAGLVKLKEGYAIFVNTEARGVNESSGTRIGNASGKWLDFPPPLRFTLAHEIAHVIFIDAAGGKSTSDLFRRYHQALESTCSEMARAILLPKTRLMSEWGGRFFDAEHGQALLGLFRVSPEVFVRRLHLSDLRGSFGDADGLLAFAREEEGRIRIVAYKTWGPLASARFRATLGSPPLGRSKPALRGKDWAGGGREAMALEGCTLEGLHLDREVEGWLLENEHCRRQVDVPWRADTKLPCELTACRVHHQPLGFLIGIRVSGLTEPRSAKGLL